MLFVPLHVYSGLSFLQSALVVEKIPYLAKKYGYSAIALTDNGSLSGFAPFTHKAFDAGVTPLYGMDICFEDEIFTLYAKNEIGYTNLLHLTLACSKKTISLDDIKTHSNGLLLIYSPSPSIFGRMNEEDMKGYALNLRKKTSTFSDTYIGIPYYKDNLEYVEKVRGFANAYSYDTVAFPFFKYEKKEDAIALEILSAIEKKANLDLKEKVGSEHFLKEEEIVSFFKENEIKNTKRIADSLNFLFIQKRGGLIHFPTPDNSSSPEYLKKLAYEGLNKKVPLAGKEYTDRLEYELNIIIKMGYADYFLLVYDYVNYAKTHDISVGPGRGSGAGSLVSYCLNIVSLDPIKYNLIFERFLNPERQSMPDIDVDFADISREKIVTYLQKRWGIEHVGHILTTQTIGAKQALRDVGRIYGYNDKTEVSYIIKTLSGGNSSLRYSYKNSPKFKEIVDKDKYFLSLVSLASKIEGLPRQAGLHAAGIVLNDRPLAEVMPISNNDQVGYVACLEKDYLEEQGFLKMDILGLNNLSIIDECLELIEKYEGVKLDYSTLPYNDPEAIKIIREGKTMGIFQIEKKGMKEAIKEVKPTSFEDVSALLALYRPGPMDSIPSFARRKAGLEKITYLSPELEPILKETYGIIVYQEQIMQMVRAMAGFSYGQADLFRRAISKKDESKLASLKENFILGCIKQGKEEGLAKKIFDLIYKFADYGFNKSHAFSYGVITCQMAYLKAHYPNEFYSAILNSMATDSEDFSNTLSELKSMNIKLSVPDINESSLGYIMDEQKIISPLSMIKGLQRNYVEGYIDERNRHGKYEDIFDFASRNKKNKLNLQTLVTLIDAGCFDSLYPSRESLRASAYKAMQYAEVAGGEDGQQFLLDLGLPKPEIENVLDDKKTNLEREYEALGIMISDSILSAYKERLEEEKIVPLSEIDEGNARIKTAGVIKNIHPIRTKTNKNMAYIQLFDDVTEKEFTMFPETYEKTYVYLKENAPIIIICHKNSYRGEVSFVIDEVSLLGD